MDTDQKIKGLNDLICSLNLLNDYQLEKLSYALKLLDVEEKIEKVHKIDKILSFIKKSTLAEIRLLTRKIISIHHIETKYDIVIKLIKIIILMGDKLDPNWPFKWNILRK